MANLNVPTYYETDQEVHETAAAALAYILEGDPLNEVYDLQGLGVFAVIGVLRENDELFYGTNPEMTPEQKQRVAEVEAAVDEAVIQGMHYYPFGDLSDKTKISGQDLRQLSGIGKQTGQARRSDAIERYQRRKYISEHTSTDPSPRPVVSKKPDEPKQADN